ncbi:MAG: PHP domain-containing protein [Candidatus Omnitrophica bacterium]|nr:PHP domain-containing protein [Candidatus Omnitrophota bacterium]MBU1128853.1 PHP domain-containing protein [Candidatus Omnitrophota bacterium]MBU1785154.1 PHP domain-containing protein [Candidatus Omnitrophota bacterium]MBU1852153.1 PHP domain-containing protein [Candidatus Omnitrophota bacterium]
MNAAINKGYADLHVHTVYSDGMYSPRGVVKTAIGLGLGAISITDHDSIEGVAPVIEAAAGTSLEIIPGVEISTVIGEREIHLLGYFIDREDIPFVERLNKRKESRVGRMTEMIRLLREKGIEVSEDEVMDTSFGGTIGRLHLAHVMVESGLVKTTGEAFGRYIGNGRPCFVSHERFEFRDAILAIKKAGGVPVLAHPGSSGVDEHIPDLISAGLRGIEVYHTRHSAGASDKYLRLVLKNSLIATGGSDCHGLKQDGLLMGKVRVSRDVVETLRAESEKIRNEKNG